MKMDHLGAFGGTTVVGNVHVIRKDLDSIAAPPAEWTLESAAEYTRLRSHCSVPHPRSSVLFDGFAFAF